MEGTVAANESLQIPLNSSLSVAAEIASVESVDRTPTGSHAALLIATDNDSETAIMEGLNFIGETLEISAAQAEWNDAAVAGEDAPFDRALARLQTLLTTIGWPSEIVWLANSQVVTFPERVFVFRPVKHRAAQVAARSAFRVAACNSAAVRMGAVGFCDNVTFATIWPIVELGQGEESFIENGVKVNAPDTVPDLKIIRSQIRWWFVRRAHRLWRYEIARKSGAG